MDQFADSSTSRRPVKRRPPERSPELSPKAGAGFTPEQLIRRVEELETAAERLRGEKEAAEELARRMQAELDAERASAETATSEAMLMIERLQREKATAQMEARQFRRIAEGRAEREREVQDELASLADLAASYHSRLQAYGIDPDTFSDEEEQLYEEEREHLEQTEMASPAAERDGGEFSSRTEVKAVLIAEEEPSSPVNKELEYSLDVRCPTPTKAAVAVVAEFVGDVRSNAGDLYARVEALEGDRADVRREIAALRAERAQLVMAREMSRRLCWEMVAEQKRIVKKAAAPARTISVFGICKWVLSVFFRRRSSTARYTFGLSTTFLGLLLLLDRSTVLSPWRRLPGPQR